MCGACVVCNAGTWAVLTTKWAPLGKILGMSTALYRARSLPQPQLARLYLESGSLQSTSLPWSQLARLPRGHAGSGTDREGERGGGHMRSGQPTVKLSH